MHHRSSGLVILSTLAFLILAVAGAAPAAAQYGPPPGPPPPPPPQGGYYQPAPGYYPAPEPPGVQRRGFTIGGSLGVGAFDLEQDDGYEGHFEGLSFEGHLGGMVTPRLGILVEGWGVVAPLDDFRNILHNVGTISLRYFFAERFWLQGGVGFAGFSIDDTRCNPGECQQNSENGGALAVGAGVELFQSSHVTLDVSLRLGAAGYSHTSVGMSALQIGLNWY